MDLKIVKLNYRVTHLFDKIPSLNERYKGFDINLFKNGIHIVDDKMYQSQKKNNEFILDVFQNESIFNFSNYFEKVFSSNNKLKVIIIEEL